MARRGQFNAPQVPSIDSALSEPSPRHEIVSSPVEIDEVNRGVGAAREYQASHTASTWSSENADSSRSNTTQSVDFAPMQTQDITEPFSSEPESLHREQGIPRSPSNRSSRVRWSNYQPLISSSSLPESADIPMSQTLQEGFEALRKGQDTIPSHRRDDPPRPPTSEDLRRLPTKAAQYIPPKGKETLESIIIVLYDEAENEVSLQEFASQYLRPKDTACLLLRGVSTVSRTENKYQWEDNVDGFFQTSRLILDEIICSLLVRECNFPTRNIIIFGHGEGAIAGLSAFIIWEKIEFGGVICVGGQLHPHADLLGDLMSNTPVLLLGGSLGMTSPVAQNRIEKSYTYVDCDLIEGKDDVLPGGRQLKTLRDFLAHRLQEEEWTKPAIITFGEKSSSFNELALNDEFQTVVASRAMVVY